MIAATRLVADVVRSPTVPMFAALVAMLVALVAMSVSFDDMFEAFVEMLEALDAISLSFELILVVFELILDSTSDMLPSVRVPSISASLSTVTVPEV